MCAEQGVRSEAQETPSLGLDRRSGQSVTPCRLDGSSPTRGTSAMSLAAQVSVAWDLTRQPPWHTRAACAGMGPSLFFPSADGGRRRVGSDEDNAARRLCASCPVAAECTVAGMTEQFGIWGGLSPGRRHSAAGLASYRLSRIARADTDAPSTVRRGVNARASGYTDALLARWRHSTLAPIFSVRRPGCLTPNTPGRLGFTTRSTTEVGTARRHSWRHRDSSRCRARDNRMRVRARRISGSRMPTKCQLGLWPERDVQVSQDTAWGREDILVDRRRATAFRLAARRVKVGTER